MGALLAVIVNGRHVAADVITCSQTALFARPYVLATNQKAGNSNLSTRTIESTPDIPLRRPPAKYGANRAAQRSHQTKEGQGTRILVSPDRYGTPLNVW
jgi:hypothetical protein